MSKVNGFALAANACSQWHHGHSEQAIADE
jgi:hypothetical protein